MSERLVTEFVDDILAEKLGNDMTDVVCVVIPVPRLTSIGDVLQAGDGKGSVYDPEDEKSPDLYLVRIGAGPQEALTLDDLKARLQG